MNWMFEVYFPADPQRERRIEHAVVGDGGRLDFREATDTPGHESVCLTFEFESLDAAERSASQIRSMGEHVEGPTDYGP